MMPFPDDPDSYDMIRRGRPSGFSAGGPAQRALQARLEASHMEDIVASMALIRRPHQGLW